jgi:hypothetical protein
MNATGAAKDDLKLPLRPSAWNYGRSLAVLLPLLMFFQGINATGQLVYFLVGDFPGKPPSHESYVLPLSRADHIAHARDLIAKGPAAGQALVVAYIGRNNSGINRNYQDPRFPEWSWEVTNFVGFADVTAEILDGRPSDAPGYEIGFWSYTVVRELGPAPLYVSLAPSLQGLQVYWSGLGTNWVYTLESSEALSNANWTPIPGVAWPLRTNHWLTATASVRRYYRVKAQNN